MKKYIYLSMLVAFAFIGAGVANAESGSGKYGDREDRMGRPEMMDDNGGMRQKPETRVMGFGKFDDSDNRADMKNLTQEQKDTLKLKWDEQRKETLEKMKELLEKSNGKWRFLTFLRFNTAIERMDNIITRLEARIADYKTKNVDTTASEAALAKAKTSLASAKTKLEDLKKILEEAQTTTPETSTNTASSTDDGIEDQNKDNHGALVKEVMPVAKEIQKLLIETHRSLKESTKALRISAKDVIEKEKTEKDNDDSDDEDENE